MRKLLLIHLSFISLFIIGITDTSGANLRKGPYLIYDGINTEMKILWQNDATSTDIIRWGTTTSYSDGSATSPEYGTDHQHSYIINTLTPGTKYYYQVEVSGVTYDGSFTAAPEETASSVKFLAYGDTRTYPNDHNLVAEKINAAYASDPAYQTLIISMGDLIGDGNSESSWSNEFFETGLAHINAMFSSLPYHTARGNHEGNGVLLAKYFPYNYQSSSYYSFEYGPALFLVVDQYVSYAPGSAQYIWLENELATTNKAWKIIYYHEPGWAAGSSNSSVQNYIQPLCEQYGVKITFAGHHHYYSRADVTLNDNTVRHITTGGGGAPLYAPDPSAPFIVAASQSHHFCKVDIVDENIMNVEVVDKYGTIIDQFTVDQTYVAPTYVDITDPADNAYYSNPQTITISADASDPDGIQQVEFFVSGSSIGIDNTSPYSIQYAIPADGNYSIYAEMTDNPGNTTISGTIDIIVGGNPPVYVTSRIITGNDDVEEGELGPMYMNSTDLEIAYDSYNGQNFQTIGLRFTGLNIPQGASIVSASIEFTVDEVNAGACNLLIKGHDTDNSETFSSANFNVSSRPATVAGVSWSPSDWSTIGATETSPDVSSVIQEIVDRPGFTSSSAISLVITGSGTRTAEAYEGNASAAALLQITYTLTGNSPPAFNSDPVVEANANINEAYSSTLADDATDPDGDALMFSKVSGPAWLNVAANGDLSGTPASGDIGINSWVVEVDDGNGGTDNATLEIEVIDPSVITYCASHGNALEEWIEEVAIGSESYQSGSSGSAGYQDLTGTFTFTLEEGSNNNIVLTPGFSPRSKFEYWKVWIDFDSDGDFEDTEIVFSADKKKTLVTGIITIPAMSPVQTIMRISMKRDASPTSCEVFSLGEVEDYSVEIIEGSSQASYCASSGLSTDLEWIQSVSVGGVLHESGNDGGYGDHTAITFNVSAGSGAAMVLTPGFSDKSQREFWRVWIDFNANYIFEPEEEVLAANNTKAAVSGTINIPSGLSGATRMRVSMQQGVAPSSCGIFPRGEVEDFTVNINAGDGVAQGGIPDNSHPEGSVSVYPNPSSGKLYIQFDGWDGAKEIRLIDLSGRSVHAVTTTENFIEFDASSFERGIYLLVVNNGISLERKKVIIQ